LARPLVFTERAQLDLDRLHDFLASKSPRAAQQAVARIVEALDLLTLFPFAGVLVKNDVRRLVIRFGHGAYIARYRVADAAVLILRIWHSKERRRR
jgi:plasmid stabilization system protein ParE